jgi:hypothetical protein
VSQSNSQNLNTYQEIVGNAIAAIRGKDGNESTRALEALGTVPVDVLLAELCLWVEDLTAGQDVDRLLKLTRLPPPENPSAIVLAVMNTDISALNAYAGGDLVKLITSMLQLISALQDANEIAGQAVAE